MNGIMGRLENFKIILLLLFLSFTYQQEIYAYQDLNQGAASLVCYDGKRALPIINDQVLSWIRTSKNQYRSRARVHGHVERVYQDQSGHQHFSIRFGDDQDARIEVIYNIEFGRITNLREGADAEACGDYITATEAIGGYPASPDNAIIHWVHDSNSSRHQSGYVLIDGVHFGSTKGSK